MKMNTFAIFITILLISAANGATIRTERQDDSLDIQRQEPTDQAVVPPFISTCTGGFGAYLRNVVSATRNTVRRVQNQVQNNVAGGTAVVGSVASNAAQTATGAIRRIQTQVNTGIVNSAALIQNTTNQVVNQTRGAIRRVQNGVANSVQNGASYVGNVLSSING